MDRFGHKLYLVSGVNHFDFAESCFVNKLGAMNHLYQFVLLPFLKKCARASKILQW
jgi:hypothetical protein